MPFDIMTFNRTMSNITTLTIKGLFATVDKSDTQQNDTPLSAWCSIKLCIALHFLFC